ncbi:MAG: valine--tRNA ligase [Sedimentisphaerales bacterium]|jgi:valyl-tRNA synthetase
MAEELSKVYEPKNIEQQADKIWAAGNYFHAEPDGAKRKPYTIVIPPPNVTAALHLGHALNNTLQDILIRYHRMLGLNTLWMPGTDHAGIATQTVVEKRILAEEGKKRTDFKRDEFVARVQAWKDEYEARIIEQLKAMGCSCDWQRTRFTMDETCAKAVRATFFNLFKDGLIYRGKRLVNWDPATQTVLADDEVEHETIQGNFWYMRYPLVEPVKCVAGVPPADNDSISSSQYDNESTIDKRQGRYLPHWSMEGAIYAVVFRLADSVPGEVSDKWRFQKRDIIERAQQQGRPLTQSEQIESQRLQSEKIESFLDAGHGECLLKKAGIAEIMDNALKHFDLERYDLIAWAIMPNHVHAVIKPRPGYKLAEIVHSWKSFSAKEINKRLGREGSVWMNEYYDHLIRNEDDFSNQVNYVLANPEKAGLQNWQWSGMKEERGQDARDTVTITHVTVATTRPETMLGDTAVAMNPNDPRAKALVGKSVRLPIVGRIIPIIADEHVVLPNPNSEDEKAKFSTGFLKVTPAHDPDDWAIGQRHKLEVINVMAPDGSISDKFGWTDWEQIKNPDAENLIGMDRFEAREAIVEWFREEGLLEEIRPYAHEVGHSYRSHVPIEPYLSDQWYIAVKKPIERVAGAPPARQMTEGETRSTYAGKMPATLIEGTDIPVNSLAGLALKPLLDGRLKFIPERYAKTYQAWLENLRDWPISRQLWWGHQIPVWRAKVLAGPEEELERFIKQLDAWREEGRAADWGRPRFGFGHRETKEEYPTWFICVANPDDKEVIEIIERWDFERDPDVLDTWFSSALWPFSTLGWPDESPVLKTFYPGDVLCTAREIITLWVSRMVMMGQYCCGDIPFKDVYIHAMIQDGEGRKMSKSLGNGIDPLVAINSHGADAMRFTLASMTTDTQDIRMPVAQMTLPDGRVENTSPKLDVGRNFCNKLWNASRFAMMNLEGTDPVGFDKNKLAITDKWILSRLARTIAEVTSGLDAFKYNEPLNAIYKFFWNDFCDWYLEWAKPRMADSVQKPIAQNVLAFVLDQTLRLLHPFVPFITEGIFQKLNELAPTRGLKEIAELNAAKALVAADWPKRIDALINEQIERQIDNIQTVVRCVRDIRSRCNIPPSSKLVVSVNAPQDLSGILNADAGLLCQLANLKEFSASDSAGKPKNAAAAIASQMQIYVHDAIDVEAERKRLTKQKEQIEGAKKSVEAKLANENFIARAKPEVVAQTKEKLAEYTEQLKAIEKHLAELND